MKTTMAISALFSIVGLTLLPEFALAQRSSSEDLLGLMQYMNQQSTANEYRVFRPSPQEREAITKMIEIKPQPTTFNGADIKYLKGLLDKAAWFGAERRIMHEMWAEVTGKTWGSSDSGGQTQSESAR